MLGQRNDRSEPRHYFSGLGVFCSLLALIMASCSNNGSKAKDDKESLPASPESGLLRSPTAGEWFSEDVTVTVIGQYGHRLDLQRLQIDGVKAIDGVGNKLLWSKQTKPDSKFGPMAIIVVPTGQAQSKKITVDARLHYRGQLVDLHAVFVQEEGGHDWKAASVKLQNAG